MKKLAVSIPFTGYVCVEIEVDDDASDDDIFDAALEATDDKNFEDILVAFDYNQQIVSGNVFYGVQNSWEYEERD